MNDQINIKILKQEERIEKLEDEFRLLKQYTIQRLEDKLRDLEYNTDIKLERIDDILTVHRNQLKGKYGKNKQCEWCGADLKLQPGPTHTEGGKTYCNPTCAATYRVTQEPRQKELNGG